MARVIPPQPPPHPAWKPHPIPTVWDDLLEGVATPESWAEKRKAIRARFLDLIRAAAAPQPPKDLQLKVEQEYQADGFRIQRITYNVERDERAQAYLALPPGPPPQGGFPGVVCLHGTTNWGARRCVGLPPESGDPHADKKVAGLDYARQLVKLGFATISPEHFCCASRMPKEGPYETTAFYRKHPQWSAPGKYCYDSRIAFDVLAAQPGVDASRIGVTGHSLGGQGSIWLAAYDERIRCSVPACAYMTFRECPTPLEWSRDYWYIYFPQLRERFMRGERIECDFHEMMALIAPRPLLEFFALNDGDPTAQAHRALMHLKLHEVYRLLGQESAHAFLVFGDEHTFPTLSQTSMATWLSRWLKHGGDMLGGWNAPF